ncbi:Cu(I)-responsive transcriptional regulator [Loktanella sp. SALINAS62]|uniref:Cu(I)-responsive transcriptional regulator n=1 Tax=Loktanella sp. SALINAS62 TaxID=2706124 RepID=UPI001B8B5A61|nr:Cu(I)-responsive transcriptional regulator [Loktanella sp. SALINAS62]MBS1302944.1 Cu(I)-responsive transcriptional regulator [Loktanella sp. SALINAS62]
MNIGDIARITKLPAKTIRYYEDIGLVNPARDDNAYRRFNDSDVHKLGFIGRARSLGFTIEDCRALLALYEDKDRASADVKQIAQHHLALIDVKIAELKAMRTALGHLSESCAGDHRPDCPILEGLSVSSQTKSG